MKSVRFGVAGSGYFGGELARTLNRLEGSSAVAVHGGSSRPIELNPAVKESWMAFIGAGPGRGIQSSLGVTKEGLSRR